jgi:ribosome-associated toxin RatA of RatAB toxin-antitoxin module
MTALLPVGGRQSARRLLCAAGVALLGWGLATRPAAAAAPEPQLSVREERGVYTVAARFEVPHPASVAFAVLTDYEQIPRFMPGVTTSIVRERSAGRIVVEQEAVSRIMMFSKRVHLLLDVREEADTIRFRDSSGRSFRSYHGTWRLAQSGDCTVLTYELSARPSFDVPEFLLRRLLKRDAQHMIDRLRREIAARAAATQWPPAEPDAGHRAAR